MLRTPWSRPPAPLSRRKRPNFWPPSLKSTRVGSSCRSVGRTLSAWLRCCDSHTARIAEKRVFTLFSARRPSYDRRATCFADRGTGWTHPAVSGSSNRETCVPLARASRSAIAAAPRFGCSELAARLPPATGLASSSELFRPPRCLAHLSAASLRSSLEPRTAFGRRWRIAVPSLPAADLARGSWRVRARRACILARCARGLLRKRSASRLRRYAF